MTPIVSATWQTFRLGLHASPSGRAVLSTLRTSIGAPKRAEQPLRHFGSHGASPQRSWGKLASSRLPRLAQTKLPILRELRKQSSWASSWKASLWKPSSNEEGAQGEVTGENEISLSPAEVDKIFGRKMDSEKGIAILMTIQKRRLDGTLDYKMPFPDIMIDRGLAWLRKRNPMDEDAAIMARIDREITTSRAPQTDIQHSRQAVSQFDKMREENKKRNKLEAEKHEMREKEKMQQSGRETSKKLKVKSDWQTSAHNDLVRLRPEPEWVQRYRKNATNLDESVKLLSTWQRLLPSGILTITVVSLSILFYANYTPPTPSARIWPEIPPAAATISALIGMNCIVFLLWRMPPLWKFMNRYFLSAPVYPYAISMLGVSFSQQQFSHLFANCACLWLLGTRIHDDLGRGAFLATYFSCAVIGAYIPLAVYALKKIFVATTLGASAAVCGMIATGCVLREGTIIELPFIPPEWSRGIDTGVILAGIILLEIRSLRLNGIIPSNNPARRSVDHMGHLAGYAAGIGAGAVIRSTHPRWKDTERHHFLTRNFGQKKEPPSPAYDNTRRADHEHPSVTSSNITLQQPSNT